MRSIHVLSNADDVLATSFKNQVNHFNINSLREYGETHVPLLVFI